MAQIDDTHKAVSFHILCLASLQLDFTKSLYSDKVRARTTDLAFGEYFDSLFLNLFVSVCQIIVPFKKSQDAQYLAV